MTENSELFNKQALEEMRETFAQIPLEEQARAANAGLLAYLNHIRLSHGELTASIELVKELIGYGASMSFTDYKDIGKTALHIAADIGDPALIQFFIQNGADPNRKDSRDESPLDIIQRKQVTDNSNPQTDNRDISNAGDSFARDRSIEGERPAKRQKLDSDAKKDKRSEFFKMRKLGRDDAAEDAKRQKSDSDNDDDATKSPGQK